MRLNLKQIFPQNVSELTYQTYIMPIFDYNTCSVWGCTTNNIEQIQRLQNRTARISAGNFDTINVRGIAIVRSLKWHTIQERVINFRSVLMYNCVYGNTNPNLCNAIVMACEASDRCTRFNDTLLVDVLFCRTNLMKRSFLYRGSQFWNE